MGGDCATHRTEGDIFPTGQIRMHPLCDVLTIQCTLAPGPVHNRIPDLQRCALTRQTSPSRYPGLSFVKNNIDPLGVPFTPLRQAGRRNRRRQKRHRASQNNDCILTDQVTRTRLRFFSFIEKRLVPFTRPATVLGEKLPSPVTDHETYGYTPPVSPPSPPLSLLRTHSSTYPRCLHSVVRPSTHG